jgi:dCMP deaminase
VIIGLTGKNGAGKGEVAAYLAERSFVSASLSDVLRQELERRGLPSSRENLIAIGNQLRADHGPGVLAERVLAALSAGRHHVVDSIRNPGEVEVLRRRPDFRLLCVRAPLSLRFQRARQRGRLGDGATLEEFARLEEEELDRGAPERQRLDRVEELADAVLDNDGSVGQLHQRLGELLRGWLTGFKRPGWDEYFMSIAQVVASRSNCFKRLVAAVIVRDRRIISTG